MPARNVYIALAVIFISLFIASKTSVKEQVLRGAVSHLENAALNEVDADRLLEGALAGAADAVGDSPYTHYIPPRQKTDYMREIQGQFAGVGLRNFVKDEKTGEFYFVPLRGAPAAKAGLQFGDRIVEVDGKSVKEFSLFDLTSALRGDEKTVVRLKIRPRASTPAFADAATALQNAETPDSAETKNAENPKNSANVVQSSSPTAPPSESDAVLRDVELTRAVVQQDVVSGDRLDENGDWIYALKDYPEIGYVAIEQFADATTPQTLAALESLDKAGVSSVILDFRGNPGGFLPDAIAICDEFVQAGAPIVEVRDRSGSVQEIYRATDRPKKPFRVVVLVDDESASASEIVSAALQDAGVAAVGGARSYGKGTIQSLFELPFNLGMLRVTTAQFFRPS
ncbi:MAG: PDZ domain-containing protein, partial [Thermoguttaceae bacterium]|nr:PDZ domain-containing protein [Thermoguttaceae bacterium]